MRVRIRNNKETGLDFIPNVALKTAAGTMRELLFKDASSKRALLGFLSRKNNVPED